MPRTTLIMALSYGLLACGAGVDRPPTATAPARSALTERRDLRRYFDEQRVTGTIAVHDSRSGELFCSDVQRCRNAYLPASTFKIANALVALETGVVEHPETPLPWDGKRYRREDWNRDHTLRSALQVSCVPCFQGIARGIGQERMDAWLARLRYGNHDTSGGVDRFWLWGGLRVSPLQQIDFLRRLEAGELPVQRATRDFVVDMLALDVGQSHVLRGKTGLARTPEEAMNAAWFVGWVELGTRRVFFALLLDGFAPGVDPAPLRRQMVEQILRDLRMIPEG